MNEHTDEHAGNRADGGAAPRRRGIYLLPNLFTTGGLFGGFFAIIAASQGRFEPACVAIFIAAILDGIDGRVARLTNTQTEFGVQYDSLADLVSFGMAPALVMYYWSLSALKLDGITPGQDRLADGLPVRRVRGPAAGALQQPGGAGRQALVHRPRQSGRGGTDGELRVDVHRPGARRRADALCRHRASPWSRRC